MKVFLGRLAVLRQVDGWLVLLAAAIALLGLVFIESATRFDPHFAGQHLRQALFLGVSAGLGLVLILLPYARVMRHAYLLYGLCLLSLLLLPFFGTTINGARRWYSLPLFSIQPAEFGKLATILVLAAYLRFRDKARAWESLVVPFLLTAMPALLVMRQPDLGSSLVYWPILLAMSYAAGASGRSLLVFMGAGLVLVVLAYFLWLEVYQLQRVDVWLEHFSWGEEAEARPETRMLLHGPAYQPWQSLIAVGSGGLAGFGVGQGPQNRFDFLPYRNADYIFSVVAEETGFLGAAGLLLLQVLLIWLLLRLALRTRERFGRLLVVGVAAYLAAQTLIHVAVCCWLVPATGLPLPLVSYGGSSTMVAVTALALSLGVGARREVVLAANGYG